MFEKFRKAIAELRHKADVDAAVQWEGLLDSVLSGKIDLNTAKGAARISEQLDACGKSLEDLERDLAEKHELVRLEGLASDEANRLARFRELTQEREQLDEDWRKCRADHKKKIDAANLELREQRARLEESTAAKYELVRLAPDHPIAAREVLSKKAYDVAGQVRTLELKLEGARKGLAHHRELADAAEQQARRRPRGPYLNGGKIEEQNRREHLQENIERLAAKVQDIEAELAAAKKSEHRAGKKLAAAEI